MRVVLIRGGGDLGSGIALRLHRAGFGVVIAELAQPLAVRRTVSFSEAVYEGEWRVEEVTARRMESLQEALAACHSGLVAVLVAPEISSFSLDSFDAIVDARLIKGASGSQREWAPLVVGIGPGFLAGADCHAVVESQRGHRLGRVYWEGRAAEDTALPDGDARRVLRAPASGTFSGRLSIGDLVAPDDLIAEVAGTPVRSPFRGVVRGLLRSGLPISKGVKIGDVDPGAIRDNCFLVSDKSLAVAGGVLEAILTRYSRRSPA